MLKMLTIAVLAAAPALAVAQTNSQMTSEQPGAGIGATGSTPTATGDAASGAAASPMGKAEAKKHRSGARGKHGGGGSNNTGGQPH